MIPAITRLARRSVRAIRGWSSSARRCTSRPALVEHAVQPAQELGQLRAELRDVDAGLSQPPRDGGRGQLMGHEPLRVRREDGSQPEVRTQPRGHALVHDDHLEQQRQLARQLQVVVAHDAENLLDQRRERDLTDRLPLVMGNQIREVGAQGGPIHLAADDAQREHRSCYPIRVLSGERDQQRAQLLAQAVVELADHAEGDDPQPASLLDEEVARVRVGVKEAVLEDHLGGHSGRQLGERVAVDAGLVERVGVVDLDAADTLEGQDAGGRGLPPSSGPSWAAGMAFPRPRSGDFGTFSGPFVRSGAPLEMKNPALEAVA